MSGKSIRRFRVTYAVGAVALLVSTIVRINWNEELIQGFPVAVARVAFIVSAVVFVVATLVCAREYKRLTGSWWPWRRRRGDG